MICSKPSGSCSDTGLSKMQIVAIAALALAAVAVTVALVAALVFIPPVGAIVGTAAAPVIAYVCFGAIGAAGVSSGVAVGAWMIAKMVKGVEKKPISEPKPVFNPIIDGFDCNVDRFECPLSLCRFEDPYILIGDGRTYEREYLENWLRENETSPYDRSSLSNTCMVANRSIPSEGVKLEREFREPYICVQNGYTYEKSELEANFEKIRKSTGISGKLDFYPNYVLFPEDADLPKMHRLEVG